MPDFSPTRSENEEAVRCCIARVRSELDFVLSQLDRVASLDPMNRPRQLRNLGDAANNATNNLRHAEAWARLNDEGTTHAQ